MHVFSGGFSFTEKVTIDCNPLRVSTHLGNKRWLADIVRGEKVKGEGAVAAGDAVVKMK